MYEDISSLTVEQTNFSRREFFITTLIAGFALATQPINAQDRITTDTANLTAGEIKIPVADGTIPAYRAMPATGKNFPVVLVVEEIFGVHEWIKDVCRRFAKMGHMAIAPELFARQGDPSKIEKVQDIIANVISKVPDAQVMQDLDATVAFAKKNRGSSKKLGITGFCWGGRITWLYAAHNPKVDAGAAWYGQVVRREGSPVSPLQPKFPSTLR